MKEELISFELAVLAKEKGFPQTLAYDYYMEGGKMMTDNHYIPHLYKEDKENLVAAPRQSLLQKWLREECGIFICLFIYSGFVVPEGEEIDPKKDYPLSKTPIWDIMIHQAGKPMSKPCMELGNRGDYEEVLEAGLRYALKLIK